MKKQYIYSALVLTAVLCAGCAKEFESTLDDRNSAAIELSSVSTDPMTKAVITGTSFTTDEAAAGIGLFLLDGTGATYGSNPANVRYGYSDGKWTAASPLRVGGTAGTLYGYYPYSSTVTDITAIPVASSVNGTDYLYATPTDVSSTGAKNVSLSLSHALARVSLSFRLDGSYEGDGSLSAISLSGDCVAANGTLNTKTGGIDASKGAFSADGLDRTVTKSGSTVVECLVVPVANESGTPELRIACTIDGKAYATTFTGNLAALAQGKHTTIELTVKNTSITVDGSSIGAWGDGGSQTVTVGGDYTVTIAYSSDTGIEDDVWIRNVEVVNNSVVVTVHSVSGQHLKCTMDDGEFCTSQSKTNNLVYTFTISDITENTTATIGYAVPVNIFVTPDNGGSVMISGGELYEGETVTLTAIPAYEYGFDAWLDKDGNPLDCEEEEYSNPVRLSDVMGIKFKENLVLGGVFSVGTDKKVRFTRGNLYYDGSSKIEQHQYDFNSGDWEGQGHISHFMWCNDIANAASQTFRNAWDVQFPFFTEVDDFTVTGFDTEQCRTLTSAEWQYLFSFGDYDNEIRRGKYKLDVTVCGKDNCIVLLPDNWTGGTIEDSYDYVGWKHLEAAGAVCLPAAGCRDGFNSETEICDAGRTGFYWSASSIDSEFAFHLCFNGSFVVPSQSYYRHRAYSVRLVTGSK